MTTTDDRATSPADGASASEPGSDGVRGRSPRGITAKTLQKS